MAKGKMERTSILMEPEMYRFLIDHVKQDTGMALNEIVRRALRDKYPNYKDKIKGE